MASPANPDLSAAGAAAPVISIRDLKTRCSGCSMRELCLPGGLDAAALKELDGVVTKRARFKSGTSIYRAGEPFSALYAVRVGSCKTAVMAEDGREQIAGYHMLGDIIGLDGIADERHACDAVALEDTEACVIPFEQLETLARRFPALQRNLHQFLSREIGRDQRVMLLLGSMRAEERLAVFLLLERRWSKRATAHPRARPRSRCQNLDRAGHIRRGQLWLQFKRASAYPKHRR